jgi:hypothetical protein
MDIRTIRQMLEALGHQFDHMKTPVWGNGTSRATQQKRTRRAAPHNHGRGTSKIRRRMAARSNQINRKRIKHWKY